MKNLIYAVAFLSTLFLAACSNIDQDPISSNPSTVEKNNFIVQSNPFSLYQEFAQLNTTGISWKNEKYGIRVTINNISDIKRGRILFATLEYVEGKGTVMAYLGDSKSGSYFLDGFSEKEINTINIYYHDVNSNGEINVLPYKESQLFENLQVKAWSDGGMFVKLNSFPFPSNTQHLFAQLIASEGNQLIYLGKPGSEDFDFPKSAKLQLKDIKLFTYIR